MALQNFHTEEMSLLLSSDAKPRLKWTPELHQQFVDAVNQLGGAEKATPKSLMRVMGIRGLTLYHLKSHLQKYRLGRSQHLQTYHQNRQKNHGDKQRSHFTGRIYRGAKERINESLQITQALQKQMEVQRKLNEQIEVQRHLQLRMKAQGKYLQSVLRKAQEMLSEYSSSPTEVEHAKAQLSQLVSMVDSGCESCSFSVLTESEGSMLNDKRTKTIAHNGCSLESSLTSSESSWRKEETQPKHQVEENCARGKGKVKREKRNSGVLSLMEMHPVEKFGSGSQAKNRKRRKSAVDEVNNIEQSTSEKWSGEQSSYEQVQKFRLWENNDLNCESLNEFDSVPKVIDLNHKAVEVFNGNLV